ncbi:MAG: amidase, partial [Ruminococcus sp.]|nr:amidase [Ruminococcus sp.]
MSVIDGKILLTKNDCYKRNQKMTPKGIVVHSTGANNPNIRRYVAPDDGIIGKNDYNNDWNRSGLDVAVHAFIGKDKNGNVKCYQT